jgi:sensor histidine kinase YesM
MVSRVKAYLPRFVVTTIIGLAFGIAVGYASALSNSGLSFTATILVVLGWAYAVEILHIATSAYLFPRFEKYPRDKKLILRLSSSMFVHVLGWLFLAWIAALILNFSLFHSGVLIWLVVYIVVIIITSSVRQILSFRKELEQKDLIEEQLKTLAAQAELKALKAQINPHFLFNSLNTVASLTNTDPHKAEEATLKLADVFRYTLSSANQEFVTLREELDFLDSYLDVEKARFGDRLEVVKSVQPETLNVPIPNLILQPLVENCIKHGIDSAGKVKIEIRCFLDGKSVGIEVRDEGLGAPDEVKKGVYTRGTGLRIVNERLLKLYGAGSGLKMIDNSPSGTIAMVNIPREKG